MAVEMINRLRRYAAASRQVETPVVPAGSSRISHLLTDSRRRRLTERWIFTHDEVVFAGILFEQRPVSKPGLRGRDRRGTVPRLNSFHKTSLIQEMFKRISKN